MAVRTIRRRRRHTLRAVPDLAATLSVRDAVARADQIVTAAEAMSLMRIAQVSGDTDLAEAVRQRALQETRRPAPPAEWIEVLALWADGDDRYLTPVDLDALPGGDAA